MNTSEVLNRAADLIEEHGWTQGTHGWPRGNGEHAPLCLEGGMIAALGRNWRDLDVNAFWDCPAYRAVKSYLGDRCRNALTGEDDADLWAWNDTVASTASEVIEVLRAVAVIEAAREAEAAEVVR